MSEETPKEKKKINKRISKKELGFCKDYIATGNGTRSILNNYDTDSEIVASSMAVENLRKPRIQKTLAELIPDELLEEKHLALLRKEEVIVKNNNKSGEIEVIPTGQIDTQAVKAGLDMAYKIKGMYAPEKHDITSKGKELSTTEDVLIKAKAFDEWYKRNTK